MNDVSDMPLVQPYATMEQIRDYAEWHIQNGRNKHVAKGRMMAIVIPPIGTDSHDDEHGEVYFNLIPE